MMCQIQVRVRSGNGAEEVATLDAMPDQCPLCHLSVTPVEQGVSISFERGGLPTPILLVESVEGWCYSRHGLGR